MPVISLTKPSCLRSCGAGEAAFSRDFLAGHAKDLDNGKRRTRFGRNLGIARMFEQRFQTSDALFSRAAAHGPERNDALVVRRQRMACLDVAVEEIEFQTDAPVARHTIDLFSFRRTVKVHENLSVSDFIPERKGNDIGIQYQAGVYWVDPGDEEVVRRVFSAEAPRYPEFHVEAGPLTFWSPAEEYHQKYLDKNPGGYCHIPMWKVALLESVMGSGGNVREL